jgi:hypothetical protein
MDKRNCQKKKFNNEKLIEKTYDHVTVADTPQRPAILQHRSWSQMRKWKKAII